MEWIRDATRVIYVGLIFDLLWVLQSRFVRRTVEREGPLNGSLWWIIQFQLESVEETYEYLATWQ